MLVCLLDVWGNGYCSCWTTWLWYWVLQGRGSSPNLNHTCREVCVISLATFTIPICRWIASEDNRADEPFRSKRYRPRMHSDVDQCETAATGSTPDSELRTVLSAEAARVAGEEAQARKLSRDRSYAGAADLNKGGRILTRRRREEGGHVRARAQTLSAKQACQQPFFGESFCLEQNRAAATTVLGCTVTLREFLAKDKLKLLAKLDEMAMHAVGPLPRVTTAAMTSVAMVAKEEEFAVMFVVQYVACSRPSELCDLTVGQVIRPLQGSGASSWAILLTLLEEVKASNTGELDLNDLSDGHLSVALGKVLVRYLTNKTSMIPLWSRSQTRYAEDFSKWAEVAGVTVITTHPYSVRGASSDSLWRTRSLLGIQLVISRMSRLLPGAQPPSSPVLTKLVRKRA